MYSPDTNQCIALGVVLPPFVITCMGLRLYAQTRRHRLEIDDYFAMFSLLVYIAINTILLVGAVSFGFGKHFYVKLDSSGYNNDLSALTTATKRLDFARGLLFVWGIAAAKLSILLFYRRIFRGRAFNITSWALIAYCVGWLISFFFVLLFQCGVHIEWLWTSEHVIAAGGCLPGTPLGYSSSTLDFVPDLAILVIPIYWSSKVNMAPGRKLFVCLVFFVAILAVAASLMRMIVAIQIFKIHNSDPDQLSFLTNKTFTAIVELGLSIIAISLPKLPALLSDRQKSAISSKLQKLIPSNLQKTKGVDSYGLPYYQPNGKPSDPLDSSKTHFVSATVEERGDADSTSYAHGCSSMTCEADKKKDGIWVTTETILDVADITPASANERSWVRL